MAGMEVAALTAVHEAGHALASHVFGHGLFSLRIIDGGEGGGSFRSRPPPRTISGAPADEERIFRNVVLPLIEAPSVAERELWKSHLVALACGGAAQARLDPAGDYHDRCRTDNDRIISMARAVCDDAPSAADYVHEIERDADALVAKHWDSISRLAAALRQHGSLDRAQILDAIDPKPGIVDPNPCALEADLKLRGWRDPNAYQQPAAVAHDGRRLWLVDRPEIQASCSTSCSPRRPTTSSSSSAIYPATCATAI
jgi:hypothetical protein